MRNFQSPYFRDSDDSEEEEEIDLAPYILAVRPDELEGLVEYLSEGEEVSAPAESFDMPNPDESSDSDDTYELEDDSQMSDSSLDSDSDGQAEEDAANGNKTGAAQASTSNGEGTAEEAPARRVIDDYDEDMEEDEVIKAIISEIKKPRSKPPDIQTEDFVVDLSFHPCEDILAVGTSVGDVLMYRYANDANVLAATHELHTKAIRCVEFVPDGKSLISTGRERSIVVMDAETGKFKRFWESAHDEPVYSMTVLGEHLFATGDDDGEVKLWDVRERNAVFSLRPVEDFVSSLLANQHQQKYLLLTSGDGLLTTINIAQRKMYVQSEPYEEELNCMGMFKRESKLVVGTSKGNYYTYNWGQFAYHCDAFTGPSASANRMVPITEQIAVMAGEDGILRAMHMVPGRVLGIVGQHSMAVDTLDISGSGELIASSSHDNDVRFWNVKYFEDFDGIKYNSKPDKRMLRHNLPSSQRTNAKDFFAGLGDDE
ncbi:WD repeat-containing protein 55 homolog [Anopheles merus]|uniref:WD repeat-containing protein 55 homolog n=1 Tax=Anopheles merus TaxID=30066 RepID=UPI001BE49C3C|nr:WD repeat-containing protein 55 homolog [Anopheles merus]